MVVLAVAVSVAPSSCALGCTGSTDSVSTSFVHGCCEARRQMELKIHTLCNKSFPLFPDVVRHRQICAVLLSHWTYKENRTLRYIKANYLQSRVTDSSFVWHVVPFTDWDEAVERGRYYCSCCVQGDQTYCTCYLIQLSFHRKLICCFDHGLIGSGNFQGLIPNILLLQL